MLVQQMLTEQKVMVRMQTQLRKIDEADQILDKTCKPARTQGDDEEENSFSPSNKEGKWAEN
jgi:hypothetical protein